MVLFDAAWASPTAWILPGRACYTTACKLEAGMGRDGGVRRRQGVQSWLPRLVGGWVRL